MKYLVIIASGLSDRPIAEKDNKTPLQLSDTPHLDRLAREGRCGSVQTIPENLDPGSDASFLSLLGFDAQQYRGGTAHFAAVGLDVKIEADEVPLCCDFVNLQSSHNDMVMKDYTAGQLPSSDSKILLDALSEQIGDSPVRFFHGGGYHNMMVIKSPPFAGKLTPPNELIGEGIRRFMPEGEEFKELVYVMNQAQIILYNHPYNKTRKTEGKDLVNSVWLWGNGRSQALPSFAETHRKSGAVITASLLLKGMAKSAGMKVVDVEGATGFTNTNYRGKVEAALRELETRDVVYLHVAAAEEVSLKGVFDDKILAIEDFDSEVLGPLLAALEGRNDVKILLAVDHGCSAVLMKYNRDHVPFLVFPARNKTGNIDSFDEHLLDADGDHYRSGPDLVADFFGDKI